MALWDKLFNKDKGEGSGGLKPIVQKNPPPASAPHVSNARPVAKPAPKPGPKPSAPPPPPAPAELSKPERETKSRKKSEGGTKSRPKDAAAFVKRGRQRQSEGDHDGAIEDFNKAIELDSNLAQAYASRGVSREAKGDGDGAKSDYMQSMKIEIMGEISRQMRENPDVEM
jgi:tetratricopeptide (TPR) repeat protein